MQLKNLNFSQYLHIYNKKAHSVDTMKTVVADLYNQFEVCTKINHLVVAGDIKTFECLMKVKSEGGRSMDWLIPYPGDWHILTNSQEVIIKIFWDAGLKNIAKVTSLSSVIRRGDFKKIHKFILQSYESLFMYQIKMFMSHGQCMTMSNKSVTSLVCDVLKNL